MQEAVAAVASALGATTAKVEPAKTTNFEFLKAMKAQKERLGNEMYYNIMGSNGFEHANEITDYKTQQMIWKKLEGAVAK
jgi:hypothetical protein